MLEGLNFQDLLIFIQTITGSFCGMIGCFFNYHPTLHWTWEVGARRRLNGVKNWKKNLSKTFFVNAILGQFWANMLTSETTSQSPMSKLLRYSKSLSKSNGKKWSQFWKLLLIKGVKSPRIKKFFFSEFCKFGQVHQLF